jgi:hypothetical protein
MNDWDVEAILAYLNENAGRYSLEALRGQLLQAGYAPAIVDWAFQVYQENASGPPPSSSSNARSCGLALLIGFLICVVLVLLVFGFCVKQGMGFG